eukprot:CAMPEP_0117635188 /NCGR_PEP_ID=MMETSP0802-20121206/6078_1 /TAXON_ID=38833 /ORGANISM="Micromonas sp., Strain CCMP2099" /LENGTH=108 /DNA_ID=CAMNT_0005439873 /DNA_START=967 /DNA_END=1293 /DNA_ORIENTATION=-
MIPFSESACVTLAEPLVSAMCAVRILFASETHAMPSVAKLSPPTIKLQSMLASGVVCQCPSWCVSVPMNSMGIPTPAAAIPHHRRILALALHSPRPPNRLAQCPKSCV